MDDSPCLLLQTLGRGDGLLGMRPHGRLGPRGEQVSLLRLLRPPRRPEHQAQWADLAALGLEALDPTMLQWRDARLAPPLSPCWTLVQEEQFADFLAEQGPRLEAQGWELRLAPGFAHDSQPVDGWQLELQPGEAPQAERVQTLGLSRQRGAWLLTLGVMVQGQRVDLAPLIWDLLRRDKRWLSAEAIAAVADEARISLRAPGGRRLHSPAGPLKGLMLTLLELLLAQRGRRGPLTLDRWEAARLAELEDQARWQLLGGEDARSLWRRLQQAGPPQPVSPPPGLGLTLRPYQCQGLAWLQYLRQQGLGGILADEMGLGKTAQALAHLWTEKLAGRLQQPALVVMPTSLLFNWAQEAARVTPGLRVATLGEPQQRSALLADPAQFDLLLCSYGLLWRELRALSRLPFSTLVVDEAQAVKNPRSRAARALRRLQAPQRLVLTGTPLENHLGELWTQFDFLMPGYLGDARSFARHWRKPIEELGSAQRARQLARQVRPFILRRLKRDVAPELPPLTLLVQRIPLQGLQQQLYESVRIGADHLVRRVLVQNKVAGAALISVLDAMLRLRQVCCDPRLLSGLTLPPHMPAAKLEWLRREIPLLLAQGRRLLVFSQFTGMLTLLEEALSGSGLAWLKLIGETPASQRGALVQRFQSGEVGLMLISLKAGGVGLNLTAADTVIQVDPWWNPAVDAQAQARAHRIGQTRPVFVHQLVIQGSIEERMLELQARKRELAEGLLGADGAQALEKFTAAELAQLLAPLQPPDEED